MCLSKSLIRFSSSSLQDFVTCKWVMMRLFFSKHKIRAMLTWGISDPNKKGEEDLDCARFKGKRHKAQRETWSFLGCPFFMRHIHYETFLGEARREWQWFCVSLNPGWTHCNLARIPIECNVFGKLYVAQKFPSGAKESHKSWVVLREKFNLQSTWYSSWLFHV